MAFEPANSQVLEYSIGESAVAQLLGFLGEDVKRDGLRDTPARVVKALREMTDGYNHSPIEILGRTFDETSDEMIIVRGIEFTSLCEHHLLPFIGTANVGYLPTDRVVGLSKIPRLVLCFARRFQIQERMTRQIAEAIDSALAPRGVAVTITARHLCMGCRGVKQPAAEMITSAMLGAFRADQAARNEFLQLVRATS